jgi:hypothetical protein
LNCCTNSFARLTGSGIVRDELAVEEGYGEDFEDTATDELVPNIDGTDTPVTYTLSGLGGCRGSSGIDELWSNLAGLEEGSGGDELTVSSAYVQGIVASEGRASNEKTLGGLGDDHDGAVHDGVRWGELDEARKRLTWR